MKFGDYPEDREDVMPNDEREILWIFFRTISEDGHREGPLEARFFRETQKQLKMALRNSKDRCTCNRMTWGGICEVCQGSDKELVELRNFYRVISKATKNKMTDIEVQQFIGGTKSRIGPQSQQS